MTSLNDNGKQLHYECAICGGSDRLKGFGEWLIGHDLIMCFHCFSCWYSDGMTDTDQIREASMKNQNRPLVDFQI